MSFKRLMYVQFRTRFSSEKIVLFYENPLAMMKTLHINISENTTDIGPPIGQPLACFNNFSVTENTHLFVNLNKSFFKYRLFAQWFDIFSNIDSVYYVINGFFYWYTCEKGLYIVWKILLFIWIRRILYWIRES